jgi:hypothetical protein
MEAQVYDLETAILQTRNAGRGSARTGVATQQWQAKPAPGCAWTYSAETHPASPAPLGTMLVSWASNHDDPGTTCDMQPQFTDLPIGSPPPRTSHRVSGREVRSMSDLIPAPSADR